MVIFFVHIQKTAGTSVNKILKSQFKEEKVWYRKKGEKNPDVVIGHFPFGLHEKLKIKKKPSYFTFLRDPIERWKSQFNHSITRHKSKSFGYKIFSKLDKKLERYLGWCIDNDAGCNVMTKQIAGCENISNICRWSEDIKPGRDFGYYQIYGWAGRYNKYSDEKMKEMLNIAKDNLVNRFDFIGFQDNSDYYQRKLCEFYELQFKQEVRINISKKKYPFQWSDSSVQKKLKKINKYDLMLYEFATENLRDET